MRAIRGASPRKAKGGSLLVVAGSISPVRYPSPTNCRWHTRVKGITPRRQNGQMGTVFDATSLNCQIYCRQVMVRVREDCRDRNGGSDRRIYDGSDERRGSDRSRDARRDERRDDRRDRDADRFDDRRVQSSSTVDLHKQCGVEPGYGFLPAPIPLPPITLTYALTSLSL